MSEKKQCRCGSGSETSSESFSIFDKDCHLSVESHPINSRQRLLILQLKDKNMINFELLKEQGANFLVNESHGLTTVVLLDDIQGKWTASAFLAKVEMAEAKGGNRAVGNGGVWNSRKWKCDDRTCDTGCRNESCTALVRMCEGRFDSICGWLIHCGGC